MFTFSKVGRAMLHSPKRKDMKAWSWLAVIPQEIYLSCGSRAIPFWIFTKVLSNIITMSFEKLVICVASTRRAALQSLQYINVYNDFENTSTKRWSGVILSQFQTNFTQKKPSEIHIKPSFWKGYADSNGGFPANSSKTKTPSAHQSTLTSCPQAWRNTENDHIQGEM